MKVAIIGKGYFGKILYQNLKGIVDITDSKFSKQLQPVDIAYPNHF